MDITGIFLLVFLSAFAIGVFLPPLWENLGDFDIWFWISLGIGFGIGLPLGLYIAAEVLNKVV